MANGPTQTTIPVRPGTRDRVRSLKRRESAARDEEVTYDELLQDLADTHERVADLAGAYEF